MENRCRDCNRMCKWLDASDMPVKYTFKQLTPEQILALIELAFRHQNTSSLKVDEIARSQGNQLVVLLSATHLVDEDSVVTFIAQSEQVATATELWFRYGVDELFCSSCPLVLDEFQAMLQDVLETLYANDFLLSASRRHA